MAILKCKMCGGDLNIEQGMTVCECEYCGSKQTIPNVDDEKKVKLFERANRLRCNFEFDKASGVYESIVADFPDEAEGYWGILLCRYGIEYVDDPATGNKIATCHRSSFESILDDEDFELVMEYSDSVSRGVYREEAKYIEDIRRGIIEVSGKEEPYDIFICYKETDEEGNRTLDSVLAQDVYDALTSKGYRVFFSRISLEDKLGVEYEPYIFAALNSAKVMLSFGTSYDNFNAVWVKNEWSRYLHLMAKDKEKHLIPCYKDVDAYDMPKEFAKLQAQDLGKVGATQDLLRGIEKILGSSEEKKESADERNSSAQTGTDGRAMAALKRGWLALEDEEWKKADAFFEDALSYDAEYADAYLGKACAASRAKNRDELPYQNIRFDELKDYQKYTRFASPEESARIDAYKETQTRLRQENEARIRALEEEKKARIRDLEKEKERISTRMCEIEEYNQHENDRMNEAVKEIRNTRTEVSIALDRQRDLIRELENSRYQPGNGIAAFRRSKDSFDIQRRLDQVERPKLVGLEQAAREEEAIRTKQISEKKREILAEGQALKAEYAELRKRYYEVLELLEKEMKKEIS